VHVTFLISLTPRPLLPATVSRQSLEDPLAPHPTIALSPRSRSIDCAWPSFYSRATLPSLLFLSPTSIHPSSYYPFPSFLNPNSHHSFHQNPYPPCRRRCSLGHDARKTAPEQLPEGEIQQLGCPRIRLPASPTTPHKGRVSTGEANPTLGRGHSHGRHPCLKKAFCHRPGICKRWDPSSGLVKDPWWLWFRCFLLLFVIVNVDEWHVTLGTGCSFRVLIVFLQTFNSTCSLVTGRCC